MVHIKNKIVLSKFVFILLFTSCIAQTPPHKKEGIACCVETQIDSIGKIDAVPSPVNGSKRYHLNGYSLSIDKEMLIVNGTVNLSTSDSIKNWLQKINVDSIKVYNLNANNQSYFVVCLQMEAATGLASNFYNWLLVDAKKASIIGFNLMSLSDDIRMFYLKKGVFYYVLFSFGDEFYLKERDWDNPPIRIITYMVENRSLKKVSQLDTFCKCN